MPAQGVDALRQRFEHFDRRRAGLHEIEADACDAEAVEPLQLGVADARIDHGDAPGRGAEFRDGVERDGIVRAVGRRRDHHVARQAEPLLQQTIVVDRRIRRPQLRIGRDGKAVVVDMHVTIASIGRRLHPRRLAPRRPRRRRLPQGRPRSPRHDGHRSHPLQQSSACDRAAHARLLPGSAADALSAPREGEHSRSGCRGIIC